MILEELQRIVLRLSNQTWVRYWIHWNYPQNPMKMAINLRVRNDVLESEMQRKGAQLRH